MKPLRTLRSRWPVFASLAAGIALASFPGEATRLREPATEPARAQAPAPVAAVAPTPEPARAQAPTPTPVAAVKRTPVRAARRAAPIAPPTVGGRIVALDPETGQLGAPSPEQMRALRAAPGIAAVARTEEGLTETRLTDGTVILDLDGRYQDNVVARLDRNGRLVYACVHDSGKARSALRDSVPTSALELE